MQLLSLIARVHGVSPFVCPELAWAAELSAFGWQGSVGRLDALCGMLVSNGLLHWTQLDLVPDLAALSGAKSLSDDELGLLVKLQCRGRETPRCEHFVCATCF